MTLGLDMCVKTCHQLRQVLQEHDEISEDGERKIFAGIDLEWYYAAKKNDRTFRLSIQGYIDKLLLHFGHKHPANNQFSPHKHHGINYGVRVQLDPEEAARPILDT